MRKSRTNCRAGSGRGWSRQNQHFCISAVGETICKNHSPWEFILEWIVRLCHSALLYSGIALFSWTFELVFILLSISPWGYRTCCQVIHYYRIHWYGCMHRSNYITLHIYIYIYRLHLKGTDERSFVLSSKWQLTTFPMFWAINAYIRCRDNYSMGNSIRTVLFDPCSNVKASLIRKGSASRLIPCWWLKVQLPTKAFTLASVN